MNIMLDAALAYAARGVKIFPCHENSKRPATTNGFYSATCEESQIIEWFRENPNYNIALCPEEAGLCVIDIDTKHGKQGLENWNALGVNIKTRTIKTPSGGLHYYFRGSLPATAGKLGNGIDTRGQKSYVLLPPSVIDGKAYEVIDAQDYAELPVSIQEALKKSTANPLKAANGFVPDQPGDIARAVQYLENAIAAVEFDESDDATIKIANEVGDLGVSMTQAIAIIWKHWVPRCEGNWTQEWVATKVMSAYRSRQNEIGCSASGGIPEAWKEYASKQAETSGDDIAKQFQWRYPDEDENLPPLEFWDTHENTIPKGATIIAYGEPGAWKSTQVLTDVLDTIEKGAVVVYALGEGVHGFRRARVPAACRERKVATASLRGRFYTCPAVPNLSSEAEIEAFINMYRPLKPDIVVIDTLATAAVGVDENSAEIGKLLTSNGAVGRIKRALGNPTIILIHHSGKDDTRGARGHSSIKGNADSIWKITADKSNRTITKFVEKMRDGDETFDVEYKVTPPAQVPVAQKIGKIAHAIPKTEDLCGMVEAALQRAGIDNEAKAIATPGLARLMLELEFPDLRGEESKALTQTQQQRREALERQLKREATKNHFGHLVRKLGSRRNAPWMWSLPYHDRRTE